MWIMWEAGTKEQNPEDKQDFFKKVIYIYQISSIWMLHWELDELCLNEVNWITEKKLETATLFSSDYVD